MSRPPRRWKISACFPASSRPTARRWSRPLPWSSKATATPRRRSPNARRRWNRWSPPSTCAPPISISGQCERVRETAEEERRLTGEAMAEIYQQSTHDAEAMFKQSAEKFAEMVASMKQMAAEMHHELDTTRDELRRGVLEMPQEAAESTAQMRKVIVDQIEALAELNRIVAHHGRGLDVVTSSRTSVQREEEPMLGAASGGRGGAPRMRDSGNRDSGNSASTLPPPDLGLAPSRRTQAPPVSPASSDGGRDGWLSDLLSRTDAAGSNREAPRARPPQPAAASGNPLESLSL